ncbi:hypothetical protein BCON_0421g00010 [Botryotinia convoluta]|uniref:Uncharacterized protein n=1 Tax=Botryotinia convoluta TaxID=54673 RepID=A0A4Z1H7J6_9HELO|nr:hypothetical protein BCON_0421g00010 [Botryotinia convoluta]
MQNNTNNWPLSAHPNRITMNSYYQNEQVTPSLPRTRPSSSWSSSSSISPSRSQPPSPRRARSSTPSPPTLLTTRQKDEEYFYQETHNKILSQINERASGIPNPDSNNIGIATGEELRRQNLILKALDTFSSQEVMKIGIFLSRNRLVRLWLQNLLDDAEEMKRREGKVVMYRWRDVVGELVVGNRIVRGLLTGLLLKEGVNGRWEFPIPPEQELPNMTSLCSDGAEPKSSSPFTDPEAGHVNSNLVGHPGRQLGRNIAKLIKGNKLDMDDIQNGLHEIEEREKEAQEVLLPAVDNLPVYKAQRIIIEILEKNFVVREWFGDYWGLK